MTKTSCCTCAATATHHGRQERIACRCRSDLAIIEALEERDTELAEKRARDHTLGLAAYVEAHGQKCSLEI